MSTTCLLVIARLQISSEEYVANALLRRSHSAIICLAVYGTPLSQRSQLSSIDGSAFLSGYLKEPCPVMVDTFLPHISLSFFMISFALLALGSGGLPVVMFGF